VEVTQDGDKTLNKVASFIRKKVKGASFISFDVLHLEDNEGLLMVSVNFDSKTKINSQALSMLSNQISAMLNCPIAINIVFPDLVESPMLLIAKPGPKGFFNA